MEPMKPMEPMEWAAPWWPADLGQPSSSGAQNGMKYAFFPEKHRLLVELNGKLTTYDSADHRISGISQQQSHVGTTAFSSQNGTVDLGALRKLA